MPRITSRSRNVTSRARSPRTDKVGRAVNQYLAAATSSSTRRAYASDIARFERAGYSIPCTEQAVARYLAQHAPTLAVATLRRHLVAISHAHTAIGRPSPVSTTYVKTVLRGIRRTKGSKQRQVKALDRSTLIKVLNAMRLRDATSRAIWLRNRALLLLGFAGAFRRSELTGLRCDDIRRVRGGIEVTLRRSKTDQDGRGRVVAIPKGRGALCPIAALDRWLDYAAIRSGALFRPVTRWGAVDAKPLNSAHVATVVKAAVVAAGLSCHEYSGHSLRAGFVTSAAMARVSTLDIKRVTGHRSDEVLAKYYRNRKSHVAKVL